MTQHTFSIPNISCGHCTSAIENALRELDGITDVSSDISAKTVTVRWQSPVTREKIVSALDEINYPAES